MMNQMLAEQGGAGCYGGDCGYGGGAYRGAVGRYEQSACGQNYGTTALAARATTAARGTPPPPRWSWAAATPAACGPAMTVNTRKPIDQHPDQHAWERGGEARLGHRFCCGCTPYALEGDVLDHCGDDRLADHHLPGRRKTPTLDTDRQYLFRSSQLRLRHIWPTISSMAPSRRRSRGKTNSITLKST